MDNAMMLALQSQRVLQRRMDVAAANLANAQTAGFKSDFLLLEEVETTAAESTIAPETIRFVREVGLMRDMEQGPIAMTGNALDIALEGPGFLMVAGPDGVAYTRDGSLTLNAQGGLVTSDGRAVLDSGGAPIAFDAQGQSPSIGRDGAVRVGGEEVGRLGLAAFERPGALRKIGDNLWVAEGQPSLPFEGVVVQGAIEGSNVRPVVELNRLIEISRAYQSASTLVSNADDLRRRTIERLGRAA
jgi:flagellar basal-body rod protein FlgF